MLEQLGLVFTEIISWFGQFITALTTESGAFYGLLPLLFVGTAASLVFLGCNIVRKIMWGN